MKARLKKIVVPIFLSVFCGFVCGRLMFSIYEDKGSNVLNSNVIYLLQDSSYSDYDTMKASGVSSNYIYYEEDGKYNMVVAMTKNKNNIEKIKEVYGKDLKVTEYLLGDDSINDMIDEYDIKLGATTDSEEIKKIIIDMINIYKDREDVKMAKIS
ncbi:MAG: hypothetical protein ACI4VL_04300 [Bacilli bacterium]